MILAITCLDSASAVDNLELNNTVDAYDNLKHENIVVDEITNKSKSDDNVLAENSNVALKNEKELIGKSIDEDILGVEQTVTATDSEHTASVNTLAIGTTITVNLKLAANDGFSYHYGDKVFNVYLNDELVATYSSANSGEVTYLDSSTRTAVFTHTFTESDAGQTFILKAVVPEYSGYSEGISNTITYYVDPGKSETSLTISTDKTVYADKNSVTINISNLLSASDKTASELNQLVGDNEITWYVDGTESGKSNAGTTSEVSKSFTLSSGRHIIKAEFSGNDDLKESTSNYLVIYVGQEQVNYTTTLTISDSVNSLTNGVYYIDVDGNTNINAFLGNSTLGSDILDYVVVENENVMDKAKLYVNYIQNGEISINPNGLYQTTNAIDTSKPGVYEVYAVYEGNGLGLLPSRSNTIYYVVHDDSSISLGVDPGTSYVSSSGKVIITAFVEDSQENPIKDGIVDIYVDNTKVGTVNASCGFEYTLSSGSHTIRGEYLGYSVTLNGNSQVIYSTSTSSSESVSISSKSNTNTLVADSLSVTAGGSITFSSTLGTVYSSYSDSLTFNIDAVDVLSQTLSKYTSSGYTYSYTFSFDESDIGDHEVYTYYSSYSGYSTPHAVSNKIIIHVLPKGTNTITTTVTPSVSETELGKVVYITPTLSNSITSGKIAIYVNDTLCAYVAPGEQYPYITSSYGTHTIKAKYQDTIIDGYNYTSIEATSSFVVKEEDVEVIDGVTIKVTNVTYGVNPKVTVSSSDKLNGYKLFIDGEIYCEISLDAGESKTFELENLSAKDGYVAGLGQSANNIYYSTIFNISKATPILDITVNGNNTLTSDSHSIVVNTLGSGKIKINSDSTLYDIGQTITLNNLVGGINSINVNYTGDENYSSVSKEVIIKVYDKYPTEIALVLNETGIAKGSSLKATLSVNNGDVTEGNVALYYSNGTLIDTVDLSVASDLIFAPEGGEGDTVSIYVKYLGTSSYAESANSETKSVKIKKHLIISLTVDGETSIYAEFASETWDSNWNRVYAPSYIFYADCDGIAPSLKVYDNNELVSGDFIGDSDTSIDLYWTNSEGSNHIIYVEFERDDEYLSAKSNDVTVKVLQSRSPSGLELNPSYGIEGTTVTITPAVYYSSGYYSSSTKEYLNGTLSLYSDYSKTKLIATIEIGETFTYTVPEVNLNYNPYSSNSIYAIFEGINGDYKYSSSSLSTSFYSMEENNIELTGNGETELIEVIPDSTIVLHVEIENIYNSNQPDVKIYVDGEYKASFPTSYNSGYGTYALNNYSLSLSGLSNGIHKVYVEYDGYHSSNSHYSNATSNTLTINIKVPAKDTTLTISNTTLTVVDLGNTISIQPILLDSDSNIVTVGNITYYIDGGAVSNLTAGTLFTTNPALAVGKHNITAKYCGAEGYNPSEVSNQISVEIIKPMTDTLKISIENKHYPENITAIITTSKTGNYTIAVGSKTYSIEVTDADNGVKTVILDKFSVGAGYVANIVCVEDSRLNNNTSFDVIVGNIILNEEKNPLL